MGLASFYSRRFISGWSELTRFTPTWNETKFLKNKKMNTHWIEGDDKKNLINKKFIVMIKTISDFHKNKK